MKRIFLQVHVPVPGTGKMEICRDELTANQVGLGVEQATRSQRIQAITSDPNLTENEKMDQIRAITQQNDQVDEGTLVRRGAAEYLNTKYGTNFSQHDLQVQVDPNDQNVYNVTGRGGNG